MAWVIRGGADPLKWISDYGKRIVAVHVKDIAPAGQNADEDGWADVGHGTVDWKGLIKALKEDVGRRPMSWSMTIRAITHASRGVHSTP